MRENIRTPRGWRGSYSGYTLWCKIVLVLLISMMPQFTAAQSNEDIKVYVSKPGEMVTNVHEVNNSYDVRTADFNGLATGDFPISHTVDFGVYTRGGSPNATVNADNQYGAGTGQYLSIPVNGFVNLKLNAKIRYLGFAWTAGDGQNGIILYRDNVEIFRFTTEDVHSLLPNNSTSIVPYGGGTPWESREYYGKPQGVGVGQNANQPYAYLHILVTQAFEFDEVRFYQAAGGNFENDNHSIIFGGEMPDPPHDEWAPLFALSPIAINDVSLNNLPGPVDVNVVNNDRPGKKSDETSNWVSSPIRPESVEFDNSNSGTITNGGKTLTVAGEGVWTLSNTGIATFTPGENFTGDPTPVYYRVQADNDLWSEPASITIDYVPVATDDSRTGVPVGTPVTIDVTENDTTGDTPIPTTVRLVGANDNPATSLLVDGEGTWSVNTTNGEITFTPIDGFNRQPTPVEYTVEDAEGNVSEPATITIAYASTDLSILKTVDDATPNVGDVITFTLAAANAGPSNATGVVVTDALPSGYMFVEFVGTPTGAAHSDGTITWTIGNLANDGTASLSFRVRVQATGSYANTATITGNEYDPNEGSDDPENPDNNTSTNTPEVDPSADLSITKVASNDEPFVGDIITFTLTAENLGLSDATGVSVIDNLPSGYTFVEFVDTPTNATENDGTITWTIGDLDYEATTNLSFRVRVLATGSYANTATITGNEYDPDENPSNPEDPSNNKDTETPEPQQNVILAVTDEGTETNGLIGNTNVGNVLGEDTVNGASAMITNVTIGLAPNESLPDELIFTPTTGVVGVKPHSPAGTYSFDYQICDIFDAENCSVATFSVEVVAPEIEAVVETGITPINSADGGSTISIVTSDLMNEEAVTIGTEPGEVKLTIDEILGPDDEDATEYLSVNLTTGVVTVQPRTPAGDYTVEYTICEITNPENCDSVTETITVSLPPIAATSDDYGPVVSWDQPQNPGNVLFNDSFNEDDVTTEDLGDTITIEIDEPAVPKYNDAPVPELDPETGEVTIPPYTPAGEYTITYQICETLNEDNCSEIVDVTVTVSLPPIEAIAEDITPINGANGGITGSILTSDRLNYEPVVVGTEPGQISFEVLAVKDPAGNTTNKIVVNDDYTVTVPSGTPAGDYTVEYEICDVVNTYGEGEGEVRNCSSVIETITVLPAPILARNDTFEPVIGDEGNPNLGNIFEGNGEGVDQYNNRPADLASGDITLRILVPAKPANDGDPVPAIDPETGNVSVPPGTPAGEYKIEYIICEVLNPLNCDRAFVTVPVTGRDIVAEDDPFGPVDGNTGDPEVGNVLENDELDGEPADPEKVTITVKVPAEPVTPEAPVPSLDPETGIVSVPPGTPTGDYEIVYEICEVLNPGNCDEATVTVVVRTPRLIAENDPLGPVDSKTGDPDAGNVLRNDNDGEEPLDPENVTIKVIEPAAPVKPNAPVPVLDPETGIVSVPPNTPPATYTIVYEVCEVDYPELCDQATVTVSVNDPSLSISGVKFYDRNADGDRDDDEPGLAGWTIYADINGNGVYDLGEPSATSDSEGNWILTGVPTGTFMIREHFPADSHWRQSVPGEEAGYGYEVQVTKDGGEYHFVFGNHKPEDGQEYTGIFGYKWHDANGNGVRDANESGLPGWTIYLDLNNNGVADQNEPTSVTDENGFYHFAEVTSGTYIVREVMQDGWAQAYPGGTQHHEVTVNWVYSANAYNFGNIGAASISGIKWHDSNLNRNQDAGEALLAGWTIYLDLNNNAALDAGEPTAVTNAEAGYTFTGLVPGVYHVREVSKDGWQQQYPASGSHTLELRSGSNGVANFGNATDKDVEDGRGPERVAIHGNVWYDYHENNAWDHKRDLNVPREQILEIELEGWEITLRGTSEAGEPIRMVTHTEADGSYAFYDVPRGEYRVGREYKDTWVPAFPLLILDNPLGQDHIIMVDREYGGIASRYRKIYAGNERGWMRNLEGGAHGLYAGAYLWLDTDLDGTADTKVFVSGPMDMKWTSAKTTLHSEFEFTAVRLIGESVDLGRLELHNHRLLKTEGDLHSSATDSLVASEFVMPFDLYVNGERWSTSTLKFPEFTGLVSQILPYNQRHDMTGGVVELMDDFGRVKANLTAMQYLPLYGADFATNQSVFGSAPESRYAVMMENDGARHVQHYNVDKRTLTLGDDIHGAQLFVRNNAVDSGSFSDEHHGIRLDASLEAGQEAVMDVTVNEAGYLHGWIDYNLDGIWTDEEKVVSGYAVSEGNNTVRFTVPVGIASGQSYARFRLCDCPELASATGVVSGGEVEDYPVTIISAGATVSGIVWNDLDKDGRQGAGESAVAGIRIFADLNGNGVLDASEPVVTTNADGRYSLSGLPSGQVRIQPDYEDGWTSTNLSGNGYVTASLEDGQLLTGLNIGLHRVSTNLGEGSTLPVEFGLDQNYPNPFNPSTTIRYRLAESVHVKLTVFDTNGRVVAEVVNAAQNAGEYSVAFDASKLSSGVYVYRLQAGSHVFTHKFTLLK